LDGGRDGQRPGPQPDRRADAVVLPLHRGAARPRPAHPHQRRDAHQQLPALADRLRGDLGDRRALARLPPKAPAAGGGGLPEARAQVRRDHPRLRQGGFSDLGRRVATAAVALLLLPPLLAVAIVAAAALLGTAELFALLAKGGIAPLRATGFVVMAAVFVDVARPGGLPGSAWPFAAVALLASMLLRSRDIALA